jgi:hypothetical protein
MNRDARGDGERLKCEEIFSAAVAAATKAREFACHDA